MLKFKNRLLTPKTLICSVLCTSLVSGLTPLAQAQIGISTPTVTSGELIRASDWNKVKLDLETIAAAIGTLQNQTWESSGADTYFDAGNVGIGINSPTATLHLFADTPAPNSVLLQLGTTEDADRVRIDEDGDMTIDGKLVVRDSDVYDTLGDLRLSGEDSLYLSMDWLNNDADTQNIIFGKNDTGSGPSFVELMRLTETGNLGVGVAAPASKVHVGGGIQIGGDASACVATKAGAIRYDGGAVERCDGANWDALATTNVSDNLGSHVAEQNINLDTFRLVGEGGTEGLAIDVNGAVGIGTGNPTTTLDVVSDESSILTVRTTAVDAENAAVIITGSNALSNSVDLASVRFNNKDSSPFEGARIALRNGDTSDSTSVGDLVFFTNTGTGDNLSEKMRILDSGEVGIGTSAPVAQLQVLKNSPVPDEVVFQVGTNNDDRRFYVDEDGDFYSDGDAFINGGDVRSENGSLTVAGEDNLYLAVDWNDNDTENRSIIFGKNAVGGAAGFAEIMRINESGRVGINVDTPGNLFHVSDTETSDRIAVIENLATTGSPQGLLVLTGQGAGPGANFAVGTGTEGSHTKKFVVTNEGSVGIGTQSPQEALHIRRDSGADYQLRLDNQNANGGFWNIGQSADGFAAGSGKLVFVPDSINSNAATVVFDNTGNVGIGTTSPSQKLEVSGSVLSGESFLLENTNRLAFGSTNTAYLEGADANGPSYLQIGVSGNRALNINAAGEIEIDSVSADGTGKVVCIKSDGNLGTCTDAPNASGACSCS